MSSPRRVFVFGWPEDPMTADEHDKKDALKASVAETLKTMADALQTTAEEKAHVDRIHEMASRVLETVRRRSGDYDNLP